MDAIAKAYARRIERGVITLDDVPAPMRSRVEKIMETEQGALPGALWPREESC